MVLGTWQGVYLIEHRDAPHERRIALSFIGTGPRPAIEWRSGWWRLTSSCTMPASVMAWPASGTMRRSASGQARGEVEGDLYRGHHVVAAMHDHAGDVT